MAAVDLALAEAAQSSDPAVAYMAQHVPVYAQLAPTEQQAVAGGCPNCWYLGLWANSWPGYEMVPHGTIWLFEAGIRHSTKDVVQGALSTLLHEMDHALQRDHVLEAMELKQITQGRHTYAQVGYGS
jgi:hypothetical protein